MCIYMQVINWLSIDLICGFKKQHLILFLLIKKKKFIHF